MSPVVRAALERADELHDQAMRHMDRSSALMLASKPVESREELRRAFEASRAAADAVAAKNIPEPSRAVFHRSAASVAIRAGEFDEARRLVLQGLEADPPAEFARELRELLDLLPVVAA